MPFKTGPISTGAELSIDYHLGNTWNPTAALQYPDAAAESLSAHKVYGAAGVFRAANFRFTKRLGDNNEIELALSLFQLVKGNALIDLPASGRAIEAFHSLTGQYDPFQRRRNGLDSRAFIRFQDSTGARAEVRAGQIFLGTLDLGNTKYFDLIKNERLLVTMPMGAFIGIPLNSFSPYLSVGALAGATGTFRISDRSSFTVGLQATVQHDHVLKLGKATQLLDRPVSAGYRGLLAYNHDSSRGGRLSTGLELQGMTAPLSRHRGSSLVDPETIGVQSGFAAGTDLQHTFRTMIFGSEYVSAFISWRWGRTTPELTFYIQEDWRLFSGPSFGTLFGGADNAQDWGLGLKLRLPL
jgi:hypothetical protein